MSNDVRLICFYLPQYHPIPENDRWWGEGFTDWINVKNAKTYFPDHYQPHLPADLGYYDLCSPEVREAQAALAFEYGISGFCYYHYWFGGHRLLERPFTEVLASGKPDFPFCVCWANENWTRRWDGREHEILMQQRHSDQDDINFIQSLIPAFQDKRYIRVNDRPLLIVYRTDILPNPAQTATIWREQMKSAGLDDLYLCRAETFMHYGCYTEEPSSIGFDAALEFPPHAIRSRNLRASTIPPDISFSGSVFDYEQVVTGSVMRPKPPFKLYRGVMPRWDNTPRRGQNGTIFVNSSPELYERWLAYCIDWTKQRHGGDERLVFINAWNEWAEGCHLEPDVKYGHQYLKATQKALLQPSDSQKVEQVIRLRETVRAKNRELNRLYSKLSSDQIWRVLAPIFRGPYPEGIHKVLKQYDEHLAQGSINELLAQKDEQIIQLQACGEAHQQELNSIHASLGLKLLTQCSRIVDRLLPNHTKRRKIYESMLTRLKMLWD